MFKTTKLICLQTIILNIKYTTDKITKINRTIIKYWNLKRNYS
ncbi:MAG: hypothetical protein Q4Q23_05685 [Methanobacteriaceae archaeon]|nr:hypothetical protein [Methanobacteriaceae archaeon]